MRDTKTTILPALTIGLLKEKAFSVENVFTELWRLIGVKTNLNRSGFTKRSDTLMHNMGQQKPYSFQNKHNLDYV